MNGRAKLSRWQIADIQSRAAWGESFESMAIDYGVSAQQIRRIVKGEQWQEKEDQQS